MLTRHRVGLADRTIAAHRDRLLSDVAPSVLRAAAAALGLDAAGPLEAVADAFARRVAAEPVDLTVL